MKSYAAHLDPFGNLAGIPESNRTLPISYRTTILNPKRIKMIRPTIILIVLAVPGFGRHGYSAALRS
jgi:hypothetical protein